MTGRHAVVREGSVIDGIRFERKIDAGGFGEVWLGHNERLDRAVAVKVLRSDLSVTNPTEFAGRRRRLEREAKLLAKFDHNNIVRIYDLIDLGGESVGLVMEYVPTPTLRDFVAMHGGSATWLQAAEVAAGAAAALDLVHRPPRLMVHRDIKPGNLFWSPGETVKVADFGVAQVAAEQTRTAHTVADHPGTPLYMSPEQADRYPLLDGRSDQYSLAQCLYEMLTGHVHSETFPPLAEVRPDLPQQFTSSLLRALSLRRESRFNTCTDFAQALAGKTIAPTVIATTVFASTVVAPTIDSQQAERLRGPADRVSPDANSGGRIPTLMTVVIAIAVLLTGGMLAYANVLPWQSRPSGTAASDPRTAGQAPSGVSAQRSPTLAPSGSAVTSPPAIATPSPSMTPTASVRSATPSPTATPAPPVQVFAPPAVPAPGALSASLGPGVTLSLANVSQDSNYITASLKLVNLSGKEFLIRLNASEATMTEDTGLRHPYRYANGLTNGVAAAGETVPLSLTFDNPMSTTGTRLNITLGTFSGVSGITFTWSVAAYGAGVTLSLANVAQDSNYITASFKLVNLSGRDFWLRLTPSETTMTEDTGLRHPYRYANGLTNGVVGAGETVPFSLTFDNPMSPAGTSLNIALGNFSGISGRTFSWPVAAYGSGVTLSLANVTQDSNYITASFKIVNLSGKEFFVRFNASQTTMSEDTGLRHPYRYANGLTNGVVGAGETAMFSLTFDNPMSPGGTRLNIALSTFSSVSGLTFSWAAK